MLFVKCSYTKLLERREQGGGPGGGGGYVSMDGNKPLSPAATPASETSGFAQRPAGDYSTTNDEGEPLTIH